MKKLLLCLMLLTMTACGPANRFLLIRQSDYVMMKIDTSTGETWYTNLKDEKWQKIETAP